MEISKQGKSKDGHPMHYSVGALIRREDGKYLLIDRAIPPFGFAGVAGHVDEGETPEIALVRETKEESGLKVESYELLFEEERENWCSEKINTHYWYLFGCQVSGELERSRGETKSAGWYSAEEIKELTLEPVWKYWFEKLKII